MVDKSNAIYTINLDKAILAYIKLSNKIVIIIILIGVYSTKKKHGSQNYTVFFKSQSGISIIF